MKRKTILFLSFLAIIICAQAQENKFGTYYNQRRTLFEKLPDTPNEIIFLGNSITDGSEWVELFGDIRVKNRGISGDTTPGVLFRLNEVTRSKPDKVFLLIGINDLANGTKKEIVYQNICTIVSRIKEASPKTKVFVQSILPVNREFPRFGNHTNKGEEVIWINKQLKDWCLQEAFDYIDLYSQLKNKDNDLLNPEYTNDGLHLTGTGYLVWAEYIISKVIE